MARNQREKTKKIRYAVVGLGYISQVAILPAFKNARNNSELVALVSDDPVKLKKISKQYKVQSLYSYQDYEECLNSGEIDAVYIALPNSMHCDFTVRAAQAGIHVLCEKPMAVTIEECQKMIDAVTQNEIKLMVAYRLHFEKASLKAIEIARSKKLGELRAFNSLFTMQVKNNNSRLQRELGGGPLHDIGIYCLNAARNLFGSEPTEVFAYGASNGDQRFKEVDEMVTAVLRFPQERLASFTASFGSADASTFDILGTKGKLRLEPAYEMVEALSHELQIGSKKKKQSFPKRDQFAPELLYFSDCILRDKNPEPSGREGLADVRVIEALYQSIREGRKISLLNFKKEPRPTLQQEIQRPPIREPELVHAQSPSY